MLCQAYFFNEFSKNYKIARSGQVDFSQRKSGLNTFTIIWHERAIERNKDDLRFPCFKQNGTAENITI